MSRSIFTDLEKSVRPPLHGAPPATEDLTIAEHLESMRVHNEHRPDEECYCLECGTRLWISESKTRQFIREFGGDHPSDFLAATGKHWEDALFGKLFAAA